MAGLFSDLDALALTLAGMQTGGPNRRKEAPLPPGKTRQFPGGPTNPERHPVRPKLPGSRDRNRIDPSDQFRPPTLLKV